ncbi:hypothetical protein [Aliikangiella coralliicola]|uniref:Uncharacterized protein n=1 Tax=Aliikangiella coralliicola TaxID=2592383 RepID=A0A545UIV4_9GAMM|nr:hypothetical protein [Aliikangiella coralliicola]TQV89392.1 hypothetical protein FLL46_00475 [Aliikangiella coralliicola]
MSKNKKNSISLFRETLFGMIVSFLVAVFSALVTSWTSETADLSIKSFLDLFSTIHWTLWFIVTLTVFVVVSTIVSFRDKGDIWSVIFKIPVWKDLRSFADQKVAKISYFILVAIPISVYITHLNPTNIPALNNIEIPINIKFTFFASWFFTIALILFTIGFPKEFILSNPIEKAKNLNIVMNSVTETNLKIQEPVEIDDPELDKSNLILRAFTYEFYLLGILCSLAVLIRSGWYVGNA